MAGEKLYTPEDVAARIEVTKRTVYNFIKDGKIATIPIGGLLRVTEGELNRIMTEGIAAGRRGRPRKGGGGEP
jgi:excisionase family DNA binding protein